MTSAALLMVCLNVDFISATAWTNSFCSSPDDLSSQYLTNSTVQLSTSRSVTLHKNPENPGKTREITKMTNSFDVKNYLRNRAPLQSCNNSPFQLGQKIDQSVPTFLNCSQKATIQIEYTTFQCLATPNFGDWTRDRNTCMHPSFAKLFAFVAR